MAIKTIPLTRLEADLQATLRQCADSGDIVVVEMPDHRLLAIQALESAGDGDDSLIDGLVASDAAFAALVERSKTSARRPFAPAPR